MIPNRQGGLDQQPSLKQSDGYALPLQSRTEFTWATDAEGIIDWVDGRGFESMVEPLVGRTWREVVHPDDRRCWDEQWDKARRSGTVFESEQRLRVSEGQYRWFLVRAWALWDREGNVDRWFGSSSDIEEIKQAEQAFLEAELRPGRGLPTASSHVQREEELEISHLLDIQFVQPLLETWYSLTKMGVCIQDTRGVHFYAASRRICSDFHKASVTTCQRCLESDLELGKGISPGQWRIAECKNHLWDIATPIVVNGQQIGTIFTGQFFPEDSAPDRELFRAQARQFGFDEEEYLSAFDEVPRLSSEHVERGISLLVAMSNMIAGLCYTRLRLDRAISKLDAQSDYLRREQEIAEHVETAAGIGSWRFDTAPDNVYLSDETCHILGVPADPTMTRASILQMIDPEDQQLVEYAFGSEQPNPIDIELRVSTPQHIVVIRVWRHWDEEGQLTDAFGTLKESRSRPEDVGQLQAIPLYSSNHPESILTTTSMAHHGKRQAEPD
jgi:PAS domain S-box-containing protein